MVEIAKIDDVPGDPHRETRPDREPFGFDEAALFRRLGGDAASVEALLRAFASETPKLLAKLKDAVSRADTAQIRLLAHSIKGSALWIGAETAASCADALERKASTDRAPISESDVSDLLANVEALVGALIERKSAPQD